jgi:hypothetical protein
MLLLLLLLVSLLPLPRLLLCLACHTPCAARLHGF